MRLTFNIFGQAVRFPRAFCSAPTRTMFVNPGNRTVTNEQQRNDSLLLGSFGLAGRDEWKGALQMVQTRT